uniref:Uncharacterized protein n=1 Tax=Lutzomyia longipalpis TaxID=7200 RepID=A0A1B0GGY9_LUTLO
MSQSESDSGTPRRRTLGWNVALFTNKFLLFVPFFLVLCTNTSVAIKCVCNLEECDNIRPQDCPGKGITVWDPCHFPRLGWECLHSLENIIKAEMEFDEDYTISPQQFGNVHEDTRKAKKSSSQELQYIDIM